MSDSAISSDPTKKALYTPVGGPPPAPVPAKKSINLDYVPSGAAVTWKPPAPLATTDPSLWPNDVLERNYSALTARFAAQPGSITKEDRSLLAAMEKVISERQGTAKETPKTPVTMLADSGATLGKGIEKAHMTTADVEKYVAEYTAYVGSKKAQPKYAALHADALVAGPKIIEARRAADEQKKVDELRLQVGQMANAATTKSVQVPMPVGLQPSLMVSNVSIPVATGVDAAMGLVPVVGQLWGALEIATGKTMGGLGVEIPMGERVLNATLLVIPHAAKILAGGAKSAALVVEIAKRTGKSPDQVITLLARARTLEKDASLLADASARMKAGKPLLPAHEAAVGRAEGQLAFKMRKYQPTTTADPSLPAGEGGTDKYGNVWFSPHGTKQDVALANAHESVHSWLSPKTLNNLREVRADVSMAGYAKSNVLRYVEEAAAEVYAQCKVKGLSPQSVLTGIKFPTKNGYVTLGPAVSEPPGLAKKFRVGVLPEAGIGLIVIGGVTYAAKVVAETTADAVVAAKKKKAPR